MPSYSSKLQLSSTARSGNIILADIDKIKGAFKVYTSTALNSESVNYFADGQIVYVEDSGSVKVKLPSKSVFVPSEVP